MKSFTYLFVMSLAGSITLSGAPSEAADKKYRYDYPRPGCVTEYLQSQGEATASYSCPLMNDFEELPRDDQEPFASPSRRSTTNYFEDLPRD